MFAQRSNVIQRQIAGGVAPAVTQLVVIDAEVIAQITACLLYTSRHGRSCSRHERFRCRSCKRVFQLTYSYEARKPGFKELIVEMAHNGTGAVISPEH